MDVFVILSRHYFMQPSADGAVEGTTNNINIYYMCDPQHNQARLAQLVERKALNLVVVGSSPTVGELVLFYFFSHSSRSKEP